MKQKLIFLLIAALTLSCSEHSKPDGSREMIPHPEKFTQDGYNQLPDSIKNQFEPDTAIGPISLELSDGVDQFFGADVMDRLDKNADFPSTSVLSSDAKQRLEVIFHPGSVRKEFSEFRVSYVKQKGRNEYMTNETEFITESGIKLGITMGQLLAIKGSAYQVKEGEQLVLEYRVNDMEESPYMQFYYAEYTFQNGYLAAFEFGFEYP